MKKILYIGIIIILFFSSFYTRFQNLGNFYTETDDQMPISQMLNYKRLDLYTIANDASSPSYNSYLKFLWKTFKEVHRITKEGRFLILNTSPIIIPRTGRKYSSIRYPIPFDIHSDMIKMGWEYVDDIVWLKPEPSAKNRVAGFNLHRKPLAYKPNCVTETLMVYRKKSNKLIDWIFKQYPEDVSQNKLG